MRPLADLAWTFLRISTVTLGGGMAMLPLMDREFVEKRKWLTPEEMVDIVAVMQSLPGLIAVNMAVLIGYRVRGVVGALVAAVASVLSPFAVIALLAVGVASIADVPAVSHVFLGIRAGTAALILLSLGKLARQVFDGPVAVTLGALAFLAAVVFRVDVTFVILFGFVVGIGFIVANALRRAKG